MRFRRRSYVPAEVPATDPPLRITDVRVEPEGLVVELVRADQPADAPAESVAQEMVSVDYLRARYGNPPHTAGLVDDVYEDDLCRTCREPVGTMAFKGTGFCSLNCQEGR